MTAGLVLRADWHYMWACSVYPAFVAVTLVLGELTGCRVKPRISCQRLSIGKQRGPRQPLHSIIDDALREATINRLEFVVLMFETFEMRSK